MSHPSRRGVLDASVLIDLAQLDPASLPGEPLITSITLAELSVGPHVARSDTERAARQAHLQQAEADFDPLPAATAVARQLPLYTGNPRAFDGIPAREVHPVRAVSARD